jgi:flagellar biosynthetic protein FlhB
MSAPRDELDRNEPASPYKLDKAHERGSVVRSADVTFAVVLVAAAALVYGIAEATLRNGTGLFAFALPLLDRDPFAAATAIGLAQAVLMRAVQLAAPVLLVLWFAAVVAGALQARGVFSAEPMKPDFNRVNPAEGFKRVFSVRALHELVRSTVKLTVLALAGVAWGTHHAADFVRASMLEPAGLLHLSVTLLGSLLALLAGCFIAFALLDWSFNRWEFLRRMRMSRREIKDEHKEREGDPRIKSRLRELRLELARRSRSVARDKDADVLLTNPTHYAVALQYVHGRMPAPMVVAKGAGELARRLRIEARRHGVPVVEHPPLTRALYAAVESDGYVPETEFTQVARILRWVYAGRRSMPAAGARS